MGNGMNKLLPGLYLGSITDSKSEKQLSDNKITHILSIHDHPAPRIGIKDIKYLNLKAKDNPQQNIRIFFEEAIDFIHEVRLNGGIVLVHCLAGVSRSASLCIAYMMTVTELPWYDAMNAARGGREQVNPNLGFQRQLQTFEHTDIKKTRENLYKKFGDYDNTEDLKIALSLLKKYKEQQEDFIGSINKGKSNNRYSYGNHKQYPLPYNKYNIDAKKSDTQEQTSNNDVESDEKIEKSKNERELTDEEKDQVVKKLFKLI